MDGMKTALYCRIANADNTAMALQEEMLLRYAADNGYNDFIIYRDNGESGLTLDRPGMNALMADVRKGRIQTIIHDNLSYSRLGFDN